MHALHISLSSYGCGQQIMHLKVNLKKASLVRLTFRGKMILERLVLRISLEGPVTVYL